MGRPLAKSALSATASAPAPLPDTLPIFPLSGVVLLPRSNLPLNVFEPRYLAMIDDVLGMHGRMIGIIQPTTTEDEAQPPLYTIGCAGRISSFNETEDGRFLIGLTGLARFEIAEELPLDKPYRRVRPNWQKFIGDLEIEDAADIERKKLVALLQGYFKQHDIDADWASVQNTPDELLVSSLVMICPLAPSERQALLEAPTLAARATLLITLLEMASAPQIGGGDSDGGVKH